MIEYQLTLSDPVSATNTNDGPGWRADLGSQTIRPLLQGIMNGSPSVYTT